MQYNKRPNIKLQLYFMGLGAGLAALGWFSFPDPRLIWSSPLGILIFVLAIGKIAAK